MVYNVTMSKVSVAEAKAQLSRCGDLARLLLQTDVDRVPAARRHVTIFRHRVSIA
jgi:hypothetical protein